MLNNNHQNSVCAFAEPLISYLYGEIGAAEKTEFVAHLKSCPACKNELAEFGFARSAVLEWKNTEFDALPTPAFEIPLNTAKSTFIADNSHSWIDSFKQFFSFKPALAMSALAVLVALTGVAFLIVNLKKDNQIAGRTDHKNSAVTDVSPTIEKEIEQPKQSSENNTVAVHDKFAAPPVIQTKSMPVATSAKKLSVSRQTAVKVSTVRNKNNLFNDAPLPDLKAVNNPNKKSQTVRRSTVPSLTETEDAEDTSVRLADLFDELDTK